MVLSLLDLFTASTQDTVTQAFADLATTLGYDFKAWQSGRIGRVFMAIVAKTYAGFTQVAVGGPIKGGYIETAVGGWLALWVKSLLNVDKNTQTYATGFVTLTNTAAVPYTFSPGGLTFTNATTGATYGNTYDSSIYGALPGLATLPAPTTKTISAATNATPIQITTTTAHGFSTGQQIVIAGVLGNTAANATWTISVVDGFNFTLNGSTGSGTYTGGPGTASSGVLTIPVQATLPGSASSATTANVVTTVNPAFLGVTCTNASPFLGADDELDDELRARAAAKRGALSPNGHTGAYIYWALSVRKDASGNAVYPPPVSEQAAYDAATALPIVCAKVVQALDLGTLAITGATNATPIVITTASAHGLLTGAAVVVAGCTGNTAANGRWRVTVLSPTTFSLDGSVGSGIYSGSGTVQASMLTVYLGTATGAPGASDVALVDAGIQQYVVPAGDTETTLAVSTVTVNITYTAELDPFYGVSIDVAQATIDAALAAWFADVRKNPIGAKSKTAGGQGYVYVKVLESVIVGALPAAGLPPAIITADISSPGADVAINPSERAVYGAQTPTITNVPQ